MTIRLADAAATEDFGRRLATHLRPGDVVTLTGTLGAGKTSLARAGCWRRSAARRSAEPELRDRPALCPPETVFPVLHVDLYRLDGPEQLEELGLDEALWDSALVVEWPDRAGPDAWPQALALTLEMDPDGGRVLTARVPSGWEARWPI
jgi:tRNA threonylcarbamoyladenosine biosynthesis protein TsaE